MKTADFFDADLNWSDIESTAGPVAGEAAAQGAGGTR